MLLCAVAATALVATKLVMQLRAGPLWDSYAYLANAAAIAGKSIGYQEPWRSPGMSVLTAPAFLAGPLNVAAIQVVDALLTLSGTAAFFLLLRRRFDVLPTIIGTLTLLVLPPVWAWIGVGYTDFPSVALALWAAYFFVKAAEENPAWYFAAFPLTMAAVLVRVTALLVVLPLGVWLLLRWHPFRHARHMTAGALLALGAYLPAGLFYAQRFGDALFPFIIAFQISQEQSTGAGFVTTEPGAIAGALLIVGALVLLTVATGLLQSIADWLMSARRPSPARLAVVAAALAIAGMAARSSAGLIATQGVAVAACFVIWSVAAPRDETGRVKSSYALDALMFAWLLAFGMWFLGNPIKVPRYMITFAPGMIYIALLGLDAWATRFRSWRSGGAQEGRAAEALVWAGMGLAIVVALYVDVSITPRGPDEAGAVSKRSALWLADHDPAIRDRTVFSDVWPYTSWYLRANSEPMPAFTSPRAFMHELDKRDVDYYIALGSRSFEPTFTPIATDGGLRVLKRVLPARSDLPRVRYLGDAWQNYAEEITGFGFFLDSDSGAQGWEGSAYLDAYTAEELAEFDAVAAYGFRWKNRATAEKALEKYVRAGGVVVIDATGNFSRVGYPLEDAALFGVAISRRSLSAEAGWSVAPAFAGRHPEIGPMLPTPWRDEDGRAWVGASYEPLRPVEKWEVLATVGGTPAVAMQTMGKGRVYWLAYNLAWHAFKTGNDSEGRLVRAVFDDALAFRSAQVTP